MSDIRQHFCYITEIMYNDKVFYYFGKHSTFNLNDGYNGSGKFIEDLKKSKKDIKYNLSTTPLCFFDSSELAYEFEELLVQSAKEKYSNCVNFKSGGLGGFHKTADTQVKLSLEMINRWKNPLYKKRVVESMKKKWKSEEHRKNMIHSAKAYNSLPTTRERKSKQATKKFHIDNYMKNAKNPMYKDFYSLYDLWEKHNNPSYASFHKICIALNMDYSLNNCRPIVDRFRRLKCQNT